MAKQSNFPDNVHVGSPEHDRMVCELSGSFLCSHITWLHDFLTDTNWNYEMTALARHNFKA